MAKFRSGPAGPPDITIYTDGASVRKVIVGGVELPSVGMVAVEFKSGTVDFGQIPDVQVSYCSQNVRVLPIENS